MVKRAIQTVKLLIIKAKAKGKGPYTALLQYRCEPLAGSPYNPAQLLMMNRMRSHVPLVCICWIIYMLKIPTVQWCEENAVLYFVHSSALVEHKKSSTFHYQESLDHAMMRPVDFMWFGVNALIPFSGLIWLCDSIRPKKWVHQLSRMVLFLDRWRKKIKV